MKYVSLFILSLAMFSCRVQSQEATVQGRLDGAEPGIQIVLNSVEGNKITPVDTLVTDTKGAFTVKVRPQSSTLYLLNFGQLGNTTIHLMLLPKERVTLELSWVQEIGYMRVTEVKGSRNMQLYQKFNELLYGFGRQVRAIDNEYKNPATTEARRQKLSEQFQELQTSQNIAVKKLLEQHTDVLMSAFLVTYFDQDVETYIDLYEAIEKVLKKDYADNQFVKYLTSKVVASIGPGRMAPDIVMSDPEGKERKLSDLRGNVVLIDFWASWCRPCRMENPNVVKLYKKYHDKGFEIYSVSLDKERNAWIRAIEQDGLEWKNHVSDLQGWNSTGGHTYGITSVPNTVLVDREGRIIARNLRGGDLAKKLKEIFGE